FERGRWLASDYGHKLSIGLDRLLYQRADGALVRLTTSVQGDEHQARARLDSFLRQLSPTLPEFIRDDRKL
ncbi:MAG: exosortase-associated EpsI family protein, partial [Candidatus Omnitrophica bacterium]|nr:exosortase-associated EpsI family protein [Candidatus Omnitrophota bacterium]